MNQSRPNPLLISVLFNAVLFGGIFAFGFPIFNSGDDVYVLYLLGGGFGQPPTELLHYNLGLNPYLGLMLKNLFIQFPGFNWYAALLYALHFIFCTALLRQLMLLNKRGTALFIYGLIFFCIEARFLLQPTFTNTALVTALAGALSLYDKKLALGYILILLALLLRVHLLIPVVIIAAPFFTKKQAIHLVGAAALVAIVIFAQQQYYKQHIPNWQQEEFYRQTVISHYNTLKKPATNWSDSSQLTAAIIDNGILFDKEWLSTQRIADATKAVKISVAWQQDFLQRLYWLMLENRASVLLMLLILFYKFPTITKQEKTSLISSALLLFGICAALLLFKKLPPYVIPGCILIWLSFAATIKNNPARGCLVTIAGALMLYWSIARLDKLSNWNIQQHQQWECAYKFVAGSPGNLFLVTDDKFPMDYFQVWDTPHQYPITNLLYKDHFLNNTYQPIYKKFNITSPLQFLNNKNVVFTGGNPQIVCKYYELKFRIYPGFLASEPQQGCIQTWFLLR
jgi:hypothetical protein